jgi:membrane fusion protein (multidrug efflux system)
MTDARKLAVVVLVALLAALGCGEQAAEEQDLTRPVVVMPVVVTTLEERIEATGELDAKERAQVAAEVDGVVTELAVDEGDRVEEGALLLAVDPEKRALAVANVRAMQSDAQAALSETEREAARIRKLHTSGIASDAALDKVETGLSRARSRLESVRAELGVAERALRDANVRAPFAGWIARRDVSRGEYVRTGQPLFELVALDPIEVGFSVAERDSARVAVGQQVGVRVAPYPEETFQGQVTVISPTLDPRTRTLRIKAQIANADGRLRPGLFARADLGVARREGALLVPEEAVLQRADGEVVFTVTPDDKARRVLVKTGMQHEGKIEIVTGLAAQDQVVVRGHAVLVDGAPVTRRSPEGGEGGQSLNAAAERRGTGSL